MEWQYLFTWRFGTGESRVLIRGVVLSLEMKTNPYHYRGTGTFFQSFNWKFFSGLRSLFLVGAVTSTSEHQQLLGLIVTQTPSKREVPAQNYSTKEKGTGIPVHAQKLFRQIYSHQNHSRNPHPKWNNYWGTFFLTPQPFFLTPNLFF